MKHLYPFLSLCLLLATLTATAQQSIDATLLHDGILRNYKLYIPATYNGNQAVPLLFNLHGYNSNNEQQEFYGDFRPIADTANFIICLPNGTPDPNGSLFWNVGFFASPIDDVGFLMTLLDTLSAQYNINQARVYSTGMSNGGYMSYSLACSQAHRIAAIASVTGSMTPLQIADCQPIRPIPVMQIHGTSDATVPYAGNSFSIPIDSLVSYWRNHNACANTPIELPIANINLADNCTATRYLYNDCEDNTSLEFYRIEGGAHTWPGSIINFAGTCQDFSASRAIWQFLRNYSVPEAVGIEATAPNHSKISGIAYPNPTEHLIKVKLELPDDNSHTGTAPYLSLYNTQGVLLWQQKAMPQQTINLQALPSGIYWLSVRHETDTWQQKIIVD